jgi:hypothetical protein
MPNQKNRKLRDEYQTSVRRIAGRDERRAAWVGLTASLIETGIADTIYVRFTNGQAVRAINKIAPLVYNYPVIVARSESQADWEVVEIRQPYGGTSLSVMKDHHLQHEYPARDTVFVRDAQFMPLLVLPAGGMTVRLYGGVVRQNGNYYIVENQTIDLSASQPAAGAKWALIEVVGGTVTTTLSAEYDNKEALIPSTIPAGTGKRLCAIRLYGGQESIQRHGDVNDFVDLRWTAEAVATILDDLTDVDAPTPSDGQVLTYDSYLGLWAPADAGGGAVDSVNGQTGTVVLDPDDLDDTSTTNKFATAAQLSQIATNQTDISDHIADTSDAHDASAISIVDSGGYFTANQVEAALQEVAPKLVTNGNSHNHVGGDGAALSYLDAILAYASATSQVPAGSTYYFFPHLTGFQSGIGAIIYPVAGTMKNMAVRLSSAQPGTGSVVITLMKNLSATALVITIAAGTAGGTTHSDTVNTVAWNAYDLLTWRIVNNASSTSGSLTSFVMQQERSTT